MLEYYQKAIASVGESYLDAERQLVALGESAVPFLQEQLTDADSVQKLIIQVILEKIAGNESFATCLKFLEKIEESAALTAKGMPSPEFVAGYLLQNFGDRVASLLGVYLFKLALVWPGWQKVAVIIYLGKLNSEVSGDALIQFIATTISDRDRNLAVQSLVDVGDPSVVNKINTALNIPDLTEAAPRALQEALERIRDGSRTQA
ncbi:MAG: hypothetical protein ACHBN1_07630 [Heteroscytonema crispum UTEX LB 1556]